MGQQSFLPGDLARQDFWDTDGSINAIAVTNGMAYVGGKFSYVAPNARKVAAIDIYSGASDPEFPAIFGSGISAIIEDGYGGWFVGGDFTAGNPPLTNLVHIRSDRSVDPDFHPNPDAPVRTLAVDGGTLFVGGEFNAINGQSRTKIAALNATNDVLLSWAPQANGAVSNLVVAGNTIYVGGFYTQMGGQPRNNIAALDRTTGTATSWNPNANGVVRAMGLLDDRLFVGGFFNHIGGSNRNGLAALDLSTNGLALPWNPNPVGGKVTTLQVSCNTIYVGGYFTNIAGAARSRAAALDTSSGDILPWDPDLDLFYSGTLGSSILTLQLSGNIVYLGGQFSSVGGQSRNDLAAVDALTGQILPWNPEVNGGVTTLAMAGRSVLAGFVNSPGGKTRRNLAAFDTLTGQVTDWNPDADGEVFTLAVSSDTVFVGGSFANLGGVGRTRIGAVDAISGQVIANWNPGPANDDVLTLAVAGNTVYAGGWFSSLAGRSHLAALDAATGQALSTWVPNPDGTVYTLALSGNTLYVGGNFTSIKGLLRRRIAALDASTGQVVANWNPGLTASDSIRAIAVSGNIIYAGGTFNVIGGQPRTNLAAIGAVSGLVTDWNPGANQEVRALAVSGDVVYVGGFFTAVGGALRPGSAAVDASGAVLDWNPGASTASQVYALALSENALYMGGRDLQFSSAPGIHWLGMFPPVGAPAIIQGPRSQDVPVGLPATFSVQVSGQEPLMYQWRFGGVALAGQTNGTLVRTNVQLLDSGSYEVIVTNSLGAVTAQATLTALSAIAIGLQPSSQTVSNGATVKLNVAATGSPPPIYQWRLNGVNIPGAVGSTLTLPNVSPTNGGSYYVVVGNSLGAVNSDIASIVVSSNPLPFHDDFANRGFLTGSSGVGSGNNASNSNNQTGEPHHAGKAGGKSAWLRWIPTETGIATFSTLGSGFDTLLAIYTGTVLTNLSLEASDDDRGGFLASQVSFNAVAGVEYAIAVDALAGKGGNIVLSWNVDTSTSEFPKITAQPISQAVTNSGVAVFEVAAASLTPMTFQWFFGCQEIAGATNSTLIISNVQSRDVGRYRVFVMNDSSRVAESLPAALEIGPSPGAISFEKLEDALAATAGGSGKGLASLRALASGSTGGAGLLVGMGSIVSQTFNTSSDHLGVINECGVIGGASAWLNFQTAQNGVVLVDTIGSSFDTVLAVYHNTNLIIFYTNPAAALEGCDNNGAPDGIRSQLRFDAVANTPYLAVVDGVNGASGPATVRWQLDTAPTILFSSSNLTGRAGESVILQSGVLSTNSVTHYQWRLNGLTIPGAINETLTLNNLQAAQAGLYSVIVSNFAGVITNASAVLEVDIPLHLEARWMANRRFFFEIKGNVDQLFTVQASRDLRTWETLMTDRLTNGSFTFSDNAQLFPERFYRVVPSLPLTQ